MRASERIKRHIKESEGCRLTAYRCPAGVWTIGYGHTGSDTGAGRRITQAEADALFEADLASFEAALSGELRRGGVTALAQNQYDALLSLAYNIGLGNLTSSTLWRKVKANPADPSIAAEFVRWVYAKGKKMPGLVARRAAEAKIWVGE